MGSGQQMPVPQQQQTQLVPTPFLACWTANWAWAPVIFLRRPCLPRRHGGRRWQPLAVHAHATQSVVTSLAFDCRQELLWQGCADVHTESYSICILFFLFFDFV